MSYEKTTNLLIETLEYLRAHGKSPDDVRWVGGEKGDDATTWDAFARLAQDYWYDSGYGIQEVRSDLVVVGSGWWLERYEFDGSECWEFKTLPRRKKGAKRLTAVGYWGA